MVDDGLHEVFVNTVNMDGSPISELMSCFTKMEVQNGHFPKMSAEVTRLKTTEEGLTAVCKVMQQYESIARKEGIVESMAKGKAEGRAEGRLDTLREIRETMLQSGMSPAMIDAILSKSSEKQQNEKGVQP